MVSIIFDDFTYVSNLVNSLYKQIADILKSKDVVGDLVHLQAYHVDETGVEAVETSPDGEEKLIDFD